MEMAPQLLEGDEEAFVDYAEKVVYRLQEAARKKYNVSGRNNPLEFYPVMETCAKLEDLAHSEALKDYSLHGTQGIWNHPSATDLYQDICESMIRTLEAMNDVKNWATKFNESPPLNLFYALTGRTRGGVGAASLGGRLAMPKDDDDPTFVSQKKKTYKAKLKPKKATSSSVGATPALDSASIPSANA